LVLPMALAVGNISPVVRSVLLAAGRFQAGSALPYIVTQVIGGFGGGVHILSRIKRRTRSAIRSPAPPIPGVGFSIGAVFITDTVISSRR
jgi:glycerol uptake facilitator-like aquaporin